jgi:DNA-binding NarL/FixJ family response regulator
MASIVLIDDHKVVCDGTAKLLEEKSHQVLFTANNGVDFIEKLKAGNVPEIVVMDVNMKPMDGYETAAWLKENHPDVKVLALSMFDDEAAIIRMLRNGARGYCLKGNDFNELVRAINEIALKGFYYSDLVTGPVIRKVLDAGGSSEATRLNEREIEFLKYSCTEMTYKEVADKMNVSPRTVDGYRDELFRKLDVRSRVGLVIFAIKNGIVNLS